MHGWKTDWLTGSLLGRLDPNYKQRTVLSYHTPSKDIDWIFFPNELIVGLLVGWIISLLIGWFDGSMVNE